MVDDGTTHTAAESDPATGSISWPGSRSLQAPLDSAVPFFFYQRFVAGMSLHKLGTTGESFGPVSDLVGQLSTPDKRALAIRSLAKTP